VLETGVGFTHLTFGGQELSVAGNVLFKIGAVVDGSRISEGLTAKTGKAAVGSGGNLEKSGMGAPEIGEIRPPDKGHLDVRSGNTSSSEWSK
jgi:hypothetical protein